MDEAGWREGRSADDRAASVKVACRPEAALPEALEIRMFTSQA
jgi:hypothetical protein